MRSTGAVSIWGSPIAITCTIKRGKKKARVTFEVSK